MKILKLIDKNIQDEHICCAISDKKSSNGYQKKKEWLKTEFKNGYTFKKVDVRGKVFIEYVPINKFLPFEVKNPYYPDKSITIRNLATHTFTIMDTEYYDEKSYILKDKQDISRTKLVGLSEKFNSPDAHISMIDYLNNVLATNGIKKKNI